MLAAVVYTVFIVSGDYVHSTVTAKEEYFTFLSAVVSGVAVLLLFFNRDIRLTVPDLLIIAFIAYTIINFYAKGGIDGYKLTMSVLLGVLYLNGRVITTFYKGAFDWLIFFILVSGIAEAVIGIMQTYGFEHSNHSLFKTTGTFFNPGPYAGYMAVVFAVAMGTVMKSHKVQGALFDLKQIKSNYRRFLNIISLNYVTAWVAVVVIFVILPATMSRAAWVAVVAAALLAAGRYFDLPGKLGRYYRGHKGKALAFIAGISVCVAILATGMYMMKKGSADGRVFMWRMTAGIIGENPVAGVGLGNFGGAYADVQSGYFELGEYTEQEVNVAGNPQYAFNEYLQIFAEGGIIAFLLFCGIIAISIYSLWHGRKDVGLGLTAFLIIAMFSYPFSILPLSVMFVLFIVSGSDTLPVAGRRVSLVIFGLVCTASAIFTTHNALESKERYKALKEWNMIRPVYKMQIYDDILDDYEELYPRLKYESEFLFEYGHTLNKTGNYQLSNEILMRGAGINSDPMFHNIIGNNYRELGDMPRAASSYLKGYHITPARVYPLYLLTVMYHRAGDADNAVKAGKKFLSVTPKVVSSATNDMTKEVNEILDKYKTGHDE